MAKEGIKLQPKIMIPLVGHVNELARGTPPAGGRGRRRWRRSSAGKVEYKFGTMIELPRAALTAGQIAEVADFFSFGTNDLTQTTFGMSRDDAEGKFLLQYVEGLEEPGLDQPVKILKTNPFQTLDRDGVGRLVRIGCGGRPQGESRIWRSASAASMAATPIASPSATKSAWTTLAARRSACRWRVWRRRRRHSPRPVSATSDA